MIKGLKKKKYLKRIVCRIMWKVLDLGSTNLKFCLITCISFVKEILHVNDIN